MTDSRMRASSGGLGQRRVARGDVQQLLGHAPEGTRRAVPTTARAPCDDGARVNRAGGARAAGVRGRHRAGPPVDHARVERPRQPHVVRDVRVHDVLRLLQGEGAEAHVGRPPRGPRRRVDRHAARRWSATSRRCTPTACGPPCRRTTDVAVHGFRRTASAAASCCASTRSSAGCSPTLVEQLVEFVTPEDDPRRRPARAHGRHRPGRRAPRRPGAGAAASRTRTPTTTRRPTSSAASPSARCARRSCANARVVLDGLARAGRRRQGRRRRRRGPGLARHAQRPAAHARQPARHRRGQPRVLRRARPRTTRRSRCSTSTTG